MFSVLSLLELFIYLNEISFYKEVYNLLKRIKLKLRMNQSEKNVANPFPTLPNIS